MIEYLSFLHLGSLVALLGAAACYLYSLLNMAEASINDLLLEVPYDPLKSECILTGNSKQYMGKAYTKERVNKFSTEEDDKLFSNYEANLSGQMGKSLGKSVIRMYSIGACATLEMSNQDTLSEDLETDPFLNSALQRFMCELYSRFGSFLVPLSVGVITSRHYLSERNVAGANQSS